MVMNHLLYS